MGVVLKLQDVINSSFCSTHNCQKYEKSVGTQMLWVCEKCNCELMDLRVNNYDEQANKFRELRVRNLKLSKDLKGKDLDNYQIYDVKQKDVVKSLKVFVDAVMSESAKTNLLLIGPTGTGKSHLATGVLKLVNDKWMLGKSMGFISSFKLAQEVMNSWGHSDMQGYDVCHEYSKLDFLVIDDFGFNDEGPKMKIIQKILFMRHENGKPTFITSNLPQDECFELMGDRVKSRFLGSLYKILTVNFADYRLKDFNYAL